MPWDVTAIMEELLQDVRSAVRQFCGQRGIALAILATLGIGIGANTAMFCIVQALLLHPWPYPDAGSLVRIGEQRLEGRGGGTNLTNRTMRLLEGAESFEDLAAYRERSFEWAGPDGTATLRGAVVSPALFPLLRAAPHLGRLFTDEEAGEGADRVVLLSHRAWTNRFASDPDIVGAPLDIDGEFHAVVGVLSEGFYFPNPDGEVWKPLVIPPVVPPEAANAGQPRISITFAFNALGRLAPGVSAEQAATEAGILLRSSAVDSSRLPAGGSPSAGRRPGGTCWWCRCSKRWWASTDRR